MADGLHESYAHFRVGQKVVYIGPQFYALFGQIVPQPKEVYTVRETVLYNGVVPALRVREIRNEPRDWGNGVYELWFDSKFFRPLVDRPTDISLFTKMLDPKHVGEFV